MRSIFGTGTPIPIVELMMEVLLDGEYRVSGVPCWLSSVCDALGRSNGAKKEKGRSEEGMYKGKQVDRVISAEAKKLKRPRSRKMEY